MNLKDIREKVAVSTPTFKKFIDKLLQHEILLDDSSGFMWNVAYNFYGSSTGKAKPIQLVRTYIHQVRYLYEARTKEGKRRYSPIALYPIFALVPYLHRSSNIICKNPDVLHIEDIEYFNITEITALLDLTHSKKTSSALSSLSLNGQTVFVKVESRNEVYLKLNPRIFWRGADVPDYKMIAEFDMIDNNHKKRKLIMSSVN